MLHIIFVLAVILVEAIAPVYISIVIAIANCFLPDFVPALDEIAGAMVIVGKLKSGF